MKRFVAALCWCVLAVVLVSAVRAGDVWPQFRGPSLDGHGDADGLPVTWSETAHVAWKTPIHDRGWSSPVIWGDQVWLTTATESGKQMYAVCVDRESGAILYDLKLFDVDEPREIHKTNSYASPTPAIEEGRVYVHFGSYGTACLDTKTGQTIWARRDLPCNHWRGPGSSPYLVGDRLFIHYDGYDYQYLVALDKHTGDTVWKIDRDIDYQTDDGDLKKAYCTPILIDAAGRRQLISPAARATIAYDPVTGDEIWRLRYPTHSATARPLFGHGMLFINSGFSRAVMYAVKPDGQGDITDSHVVWSVDKGIGSKPSSLLIDDLLYNVHDRGTAVCLEATTGQVVWEERLGGNMSASPIYADGKIYIPNEEGETTVLKPGRKFEVLAVNRLDDGCMASPAVADHSIYLRTRTHLYRLRQ